MKVKITEIDRDPAKKFTPPCLPAAAVAKAGAVDYAWAEQITAHNCLIMSVLSSLQEEEL